MSGLLDRLRARLRLDRPVTPSAPASAWDDAGLEDVAVLGAALAAAWDADPDDARVAAGRAAVLSAFAAAAADSHPLRRGAVDHALPAIGAARVTRRYGRRPVFALVAAGLLLAASLGTVAASVPGGPLYDARVASEAVFLPGATDARAAAQVDRLWARVAEATASEAGGDASGVAAALRAYARIASEVAAGPEPGPGTIASLLGRVREQVEAIEAIAGGRPEVDAAREEARTAARALLGALGAPGGETEPGPGAGGPATPGGDPIGTGLPAGPSTQPGFGPETPGGSTRPAGSPGGPSGPAGSPRPGATSGPRSSPAPAASAAPKPWASSSPSRTPQPSPRTTARPSPPSGGGSGSGSPGGGASPTPAPGDGSGGGASGSGASPSPGGRP